MRGRKSKLTVELTEIICENVEHGLSYNLACQAVGITYQTFNDWMKNGAAGKAKKYIDFYNKVRASEAECARKNLDSIRDAADNGSWSAAAWLLERRYPAEYGRKDSVNLKAKTENVNIDVNTTEDEAGALRSEILRRLSYETQPEC